MSVQSVSPAEAPVFVVLPPPPGRLLPPPGRLLPPPPAPGPLLPAPLPGCPLPGCPPPVAPDAPGRGVAWRVRPLLPAGAAVADAPDSVFTTDTGVPAGLP